MPTVRDEHRIVVLQCDECGEPRAGCRDPNCALTSRPYTGEDVVPAEQLRGAVALTPEVAAVAATLVDLMKRDLPPHIREAQQVDAYLALKRIAGGR